MFSQVNSLLWLQSLVFFFQVLFFSVNIYISTEPNYYGTCKSPCGENIFCLFRSEERVPVVPYRKLEPSPSAYYLEMEFENFYDYMTKFYHPSMADVLDLRKYSIVGGLFHLNLIYQPPQPQDYVTMDLSLAQFYLPKELKYVPVFVEYVSPLTSKLSVQVGNKEESEDVENLLQVNAHKF